MTVIEQWWRVKKPGGGGTVWCPTDPTEQIATGQAPAWEGSTVDGPFVLASTTQGAVPAIDEDGLNRATRAVKAARMGRKSNRAVVLLVLEALNISPGGQSGG